ncbi:hypothetical protein GWK08_12545 [Leptobacterium flavescens]|uniref:Uncharacterized protein n=1 Tax=Leptobacterium flavescens TaxID=472055 RepID=A0A6P0UM14_9FLAO|nr:hypothetical protein [Leptobacterium flavescens]NER14274.1 hypothetical protein [Leptobacterium flavescens]
MKKKLESELVSIAHRILKLKGKEDVIALHAEAKAVYEQLTILKFVEEYFGELKPFVGKSDVVSKFEQLANKVLENNKQVPENNPHEEDIIIPVMDTIKDMVAEMPKEESLEELLSDVLPEPTFVKNDVNVVTPNIKEEKASAQAQNKSLNDTLKSGISIGLNDRLAFVKHLFNGSTEDFNRVISQLNTVENHEEAVQFINEMVKPDYGNWEGKESYEERFLELVEHRFM